MITPIKIMPNYWYDSEKRLVYRVGLKQEHLYRNLGNVPAFNYETFLKYKDKADWFGAKSEDTKWTIKTKDLFEFGEILNLNINSKAEKQISCDKYFNKWIIEELPHQLELVEKSPEKPKKKKEKTVDNKDLFGLIV